MADLLLKDLTGNVVTWGQDTLGGAGAARTAHIQALQAGDRGHNTSLLTFLGIWRASTKPRVAIGARPRQARRRDANPLI